MIKEISSFKNQPLFVKNSTRRALIIFLDDIKYS